MNFQSGVPVSVSGLSQQSQPAMPTPGTVPSPVPVQVPQSIPSQFGSGSSASSGAGQFGSGGTVSGQTSQPGQGGSQFVLSNSAAIRAEIHRFESVHPNIYAIYDLIERIDDLALQNQIREHVISIEGTHGKPSVLMLRGGRSKALQLGAG
ncbi:arf-GAP with GTPase, ANK repeat and PH domain-containing protein 3 isoform X2 [Gadus macrocephalus]|uniref:arf-GAP with GTPase, ANK repeat and PH domain-containing protein 3 isoform X2 n=1 Tax=Gadus macrocephalus TaxID=80720 RepID=UPI0028CB86B8|nr:arf-GAP with GTPase, ANK repeat and PH domain-containing protein 3 isoform X2 [Gadus macrocephalus]